MLVLTTVISAGYYLYVIMLMFMRPRADGMPTPEPAGALTRFVLVSTVALLLVLGVVPDFVVRVTWAGRPQIAESRAVDGRYPPPFATRDGVRPIPVAPPSR